jgi:hypothetical protein
MATVGACRPSSQIVDVEVPLRKHFADAAKINLVHHDALGAGISVDWPPAAMLNPIANISTVRPNSIFVSVFCLVVVFDHQ